ncbi:MAG: beta strand repeat-containing protein [Oscillospiraceae bacterium]
MTNNARKRKMPLNKIVSVLTAALLITGSITVGTINSAAADNMAIPEQVETGSNIYFGTFPQSRDPLFEYASGSNVPGLQGDPASGTVYVRRLDETVAHLGATRARNFVVEPLLWEVLENNSDGILLTTVDNIDVRAFDTSYADWDSSTLKSYLNGTSNTDFFGKAMISPSSTATEPFFDQAEVNALKANAVSSTSGKVTILSEDEFNQYLKGTSGSIATNTDYVTMVKGAQVSGSAQSWSLRSNTPYHNSGVYENIMYVRTTGALSASTGTSKALVLGIRPVVRLDKSAVLLVSNASGSKTNSIGTMQKLSAPNTDAKLTLVSSSVSAPTSVTASSSTVAPGSNITFNYGNGLTGTGQYTSALFELSGEAVYYVQLPASGTSITIPNDAPQGNYTVKVFNEIVNPDNYSDFASAVSSISLKIEGSNPAVVTNNLPYGLVGQTYGPVAIEVAGTSTNVVTIAGLPIASGLSESGSGTSKSITGTPTTAESYTVNITASNGTLAQNATKSLTLNVYQPAVITNTNLTLNGTTGQSFSEAINAIGSGSVSVFVQAGSTLPAGLTFDSSTNTIIGNPTAPVSGHTVTFVAQNSYGLPDLKTFTFNVAATAKPYFTVSDGDLIGTVGQVYSQFILADGTPSAITYSLPTGSTPPPGLSFNIATAELSGTPTTDGTFTFGVRATNSAGGTTRYFTITIVDPSSVPVVTPATLAAGTEGVAYNAQISATGATPMTFTLSSGTLPAGLTLNASTGAISGTPTVGGTFNFSVIASNSNGTSAAVPFTLNIAIVTPPTAPSFTGGTTLPSPILGQPYSFQLQVSGSPYPTLAMTSGTLPAGMTFNAATGTISGTPTADGTYTIEITATNSQGSVPATFTLTVLDPSNPVTPYPTVSPTTIDLQVGANDTGYIQVTLGDSYTGARASRAELSGTLSASCTISDSRLTDDGIVTVTARRKGSNTFTVRFFDEFGTEMTAYNQTVLVTVAAASGGSSGSSGSSSSGSSGGGGGGGSSSAGGSQLDGATYPSTSSSAGGSGLSSSGRFQGDNSPAVENSLWDNFMKRIPTDVPKAVSAGQKNASIRIQNANSITTDRANSIVTSASTYGGGVRVLGDNIVDKAVTVRITLAPELVKQDIKLYASLDNTFTTSTKNLFSRHYSNTFRVIYFAQQGDIGQKAAIAAKVDLTGMSTSNLYFYSYDSTKNSIVPITQPNYWVDSNGYLRFETSVLGTIIISDGPLAKK